MPLRASSHPGSPNSPSCSALAWYSCWLGLSPWGESWKRTRVARTAALTRYRYATQPTIIIITYHRNLQHLTKYQKHNDCFCLILLPNKWLFRLITTQRFDNVYLMSSCFVSDQSVSWASEWPTILCVPTLMAIIWWYVFRNYSTLQGFCTCQMMSWNGNNFCITGPLWGESMSGWWIP